MIKPNLFYIQKELLKQINLNVIWKNTTKQIAWSFCCILAHLLIHIMPVIPVLFFYYFCLASKRRDKSQLFNKIT
jgi:hypothetical protein